MKYLLLLIFVLPLYVFSQSVKITKTNGKTVYIEEGRRVKIVTKKDKVFFGRLKFPDSEHIILRKDTIAIADIAKMQRRQLAKTIGSAALIPLSSLAIPFGLGIALADTHAAGIIIASGFTGIPTGILLPIVGKTYTDEHWTFSIEGK